MVMGSLGTIDRYLRFTNLAQVLVMTCAEFFFGVRKLLTTIKCFFTKYNFRLLSLLLRSEKITKTKTVIGFLHTCLLLICDVQRS